jgi:hypothetical protein
MRDRAIGSALFVRDENAANDPDDTNDNCVVGDSSPFHRDTAEWTPFNEPFSIRLTQALGAGDEGVPPRREPASRHDLRRPVCPGPWSAERNA